MEMSEDEEVSVCVLGKKSCRALQKGNAPNWSLNFVPKMIQNNFKLTGLHQS